MRQTTKFGVVQRWRIFSEFFLFCFVSIVIIIITTTNDDDDDRITSKTA